MEEQPTTNEEFVINVTSEEPLYVEPIEMSEGTLTVTVIETDKGYAIILQTDEGIAVVDLLEDSAEAIARAKGLTEMFISSIPEDDFDDSFEEDIEL